MRIVDIKDYLPKKVLKGQDAYTITIKVNRDDISEFTYTIDPESCVDTLDGLRFVMYHLSEIATDLCYGLNPELIVQLQELLEHGAEEE